MLTDKCYCGKPWSEVKAHMEAQHRPCARAYVAGLRWALEASTEEQVEAEIAKVERGE